MRTERRSGISNSITQVVGPLAFVLTATVSATPAQADSLPAIAGRALTSATQHCFSPPPGRSIDNGVDAGALQNSCKMGATLLIPVPIRTVGFSAVHVRVHRPSRYASGMPCRAVVNPHEGGRASYSTRGIASGDGYQTIDLGIVHVPYGATLLFICEVGPSEMILQVNWTQ